MSRRTFAAAGLIAAALGSPAAAQAPNPWRGETAPLPTAPAPRGVAPKPTRQIIIGVGFNGVTGLTGTIVYREDAPLVPAAGEVTLPAAWQLERAPRGAPPAPRFMPPPAPLPVERQ